MENKMNLFSNKDKNKKKGIGIGNSDFRKLIEKDCYLVDKTKLIEDIINDGSEVILFTRPRRFGKTLNMSMLEEFFNIEKNSKELFRNTYIYGTKYIDGVNTYPTIFISFKSCKGNTKEELLDGIYKILENTLDILTMYIRYNNININSKIKNKINLVYDVISNKDYRKYIEIKDILKLVTQAYYEIYNQKVILIIDEYDTPIQSSYENGSYNNIKLFFTGLYGEVLKDNIYLEKGILTGIQQITKESIFSGLNNLNVNTVLSNTYNNYFGFTTGETNKILDYYGLRLNDKVTKMYNGYNFSNSEIYNPWSIINYCREKELKDYWVNTASNDMLISGLKNTDILDIFLKLILDGKVKSIINTDANFKNEIDTDSFLGLLLNAGYITLVNKVNVDMKKIPVEIRNVNAETMSDLKSIYSSWYKIKTNDRNKCFELHLLLFKDYKIHEFFKEFKKLLKTRFSCYNLQESSYQVLWVMFSLNVNTDDYFIKSEFENGYGRADLVFISKKENLKNIIIELKYSKDDNNNIVKDAYKALSQIKEKEYYSGLKGDTILLGVAHHNKYSEYCYEEVGL